MRKYPRTPPVRGSRLQPGHEGLNVVAFSDIANKPLIIEKKIDGANCGIKLRRRWRAYFAKPQLLPLERQFGLLKSWASMHAVLSGESSMAGVTCF